MCGYKNRLYYCEESGLYYLKIYTEEYDRAKKEMKRLEKRLNRTEDPKFKSELRYRFDKAKERRNNAVYYKVVDPSDYPEAKINTVSHVPAMTAMPVVRRTACTRDGIRVERYA